MNLLREASLWQGVLNMVGNSLVGLFFAVLGATLARLLQDGG
jgi:fluoride ion exporter CrcB/FEX